MASLIARTQLAAQSNAPAFITGENGTGKEHIAQMLHAHSKRSAEPFVAVNCAALPRELIEAELFGSVRGSYTGATSDRLGLFRAAGKGTIFLDELAEMPIDTQSKLLRVIQDRKGRAIGESKDYPIECRIVAATNRDVKEAIAEHKLRMDLYYRLAVITLHISPLRERPQDIEALVEYFVAKFGAEESKTVTLQDDLMSYLQGCSWKGNVRELQNALHRAIIFTQTNVLSPDDFEVQEHKVSQPAMQIQADKTDTLIHFLAKETFTLEQLEQAALTGALIRNKGNKQAVATDLNIGRQTCYNKIVLYGIDSDAFRSKKLNIVRVPVKVITPDMDTNETMPMSEALRKFIYDHMPNGIIMSREEICKATSERFKIGEISVSRFSNIAAKLLERKHVNQYVRRADLPDGIVVDARKSLTPSQTTDKVLA